MWSRDGLKSGTSTMMPMYRSTPHLFVYQPCEDDDDVGDTVVMDDDVETEPSDSGYADSTRSVGAGSGGSATTPEAIYYSTMELAQRKEKEAIRRLSLKYGGDGGEVYSNGSSSGSSSCDSADGRNPAVNPMQLTELELLRVETFFRGNQTQIFVGKSLANL